MCVCDKKEKEIYRLKFWRMDLTTDNEIKLYLINPFVNMTDDLLFEYLLFDICYKLLLSLYQSYLELLLKCVI